MLSPMQHLREPGRLCLCGGSQPQAAAPVPPTARKDKCPSFQCHLVPVELNPRASSWSPGPPPGPQGHPRETALGRVQRPHPTTFLGPLTTTPQAGPPGLGERPEAAPELWS